MFDYTGRNPSPESFTMQDGRTIFVPKSPMKGVYSRFTAQVLHTPEAGLISIRATSGARLFCACCVLAGLALLLLKIGAGLPGPLVIGSVLLLAMGLVGYTAWLQERTIRLDREYGLVILKSSGLITGKEHRAYPHSEVAAIQFLQVEIGSPEDIATVYEVNLVTALPPGERVWLYSHYNRIVAWGVAQQFAHFLSIPVLK